VLAATGCRGRAVSAPAPRADASSAGAGGALLAARAPGDSTLALTNRTGAPVYTFVVGRERSALVRWAPCVDAATCPPIAPGETRQVPLVVRAPDGGREPEALVHWWHAVPAPGGGVRPDSIRVVTVPL